MQWCHLPSGCPARLQLHVMVPSKAGPLHDCSSSQQSLILVQPQWYLVRIDPCIPNLSAQTAKGRSLCDEITSVWFHHIVVSLSPPEYPTGENKGEAPLGKIRDLANLQLKLSPGCESTRDLPLYSLQGVTKHLNYTYRTHVFKSLHTMPTWY